MEETTTMRLSDEDRERLLDRFPLTDFELDVLMEFRQRDTTVSLLNGSHQPMEVALLNNSSEVRALWNWALENCSAVDDSAPEHGTFLEAACSLLGRRGEAVLQRALFHSQTGEKTMDAVVRFLFELVYMDGQIKHNLEQHDDNAAVETTTKDAPTEATTTTTTTASVLLAPHSWIASLRAMARKTTTTTTTQNELTWPTFHAWITECAPWLHTVIPSLFHFVWFGTNNNNMDKFRPGYPWSLPEFMIPADWNMAFARDSLPLVAPLGAMLGPGRLLYGIYSTDEQGKHFGTLQQALSGYVGPTLMLVGTTTHQVFGYYTQAPWMTGTKAGWHGNMVIQEDGSELSNQAFLCTLAPTWQMFNRTYDDTSGGLQWLKMAHTSRTTMPYSGLAVGGMHPDAPRLLLKENLEQCQSMTTDRPFGSGCLVPSNNGNKDAEDEECVLFDVDWIDVYAVVDSHDHANPKAEFEKRLAAGQAVLQTREWHRHKSAFVDKSQFVDDFASGFFGSGKLYAHREQARGRAEFIVSDDGKGYFIDKDAKSTDPRNTMSQPLLPNP